jgi:hypothetical protein
MHHSSPCLLAVVPREGLKDHLATPGMRHHKWDRSGYGHMVGLCLSTFSRGEYNPLASESGVEHDLWMSSCCHGVKEDGAAEKLECRGLHKRYADFISKFEMMFRGVGCQFPNHTGYAFVHPFACAIFPLVDDSGSINIHIFRCLLIFS